MGCRSGSSWPPVASRCSGWCSSRRQLSEVLDVVDPVDPDDRRSVTSAVEWSYGLLSADAQRFFDRMVVGSGRGDPGGLAHLWPAGPASAMPLLSELVESSLVDADLTRRTAAVPGARGRAARATRTRRRPTSGSTPLEALRRWMQHHVDQVLELQYRRSPDASVLMRREVDNVAAALARDGDLAAVASLAAGTAVHVADQPQPELLVGCATSTAPEGNDDDDIDAAGVGRGDRGVAHRDARRRPAAPRSRPRPPRRRPSHALARQPVGAGRRPVRRGARRGRGDDGGAPRRHPCPGLRARDRRGLRGAHQPVQRPRPRPAAWVEREQALLDEVSTQDAFIAYTYGELRSATDPEAAAGGSARRSSSASRTASCSTSRSPASASPRCWFAPAGSSAAAPACADAIRTTTRLGLWPQAWTALRVTAELLVAAGEPGLAGLVLGTGDADPRATEVLAPERERQQALWDDIAARTGVAERGGDPSAAVHRSGRPRSSMPSWPSSTPSEPTPGASADAGAAPEVERS